MFKSLIKWYQNNSRDLPWRDTSDPYKIWLSEIILQQTRVDQGLSYYNKFIDRFPSINDLSSATIDEVLLLWQGLGYYSRARNLHHAAQTVANIYKGIFPQKLEDIRSLKGVGDYTAAAIASFAYNQPVAVVDGNVFRVLARFFEENTPIDTSEGKKLFNELAHQVLNKKEPGLHNQAMMELGATVCVPRAPKCYECPIKVGCAAYSSSKFLDFPVKKGKIKQRQRYLFYLLIFVGENIFIEKRQGKDIWEGLYQFPLMENKKMLTDKQIFRAIKKIDLLNTEQEYAIQDISPEIKHILSHQVIHARFITISFKSKVAIKNTHFLAIPFEQINEYPMPRLITRFIDQYHPKYSLQHKLGH